MAATDVMLMPGVPTLQAAIPAPAMMASLEMGSAVQQNRWRRSALLGTSTGTNAAKVSKSPTIAHTVQSVVYYKSYVIFHADINECREELDECHSDAVCTNTRGNYTCTCRPGYTGNGFTCTPLQLSFPCGKLLTLHTDTHTYTHTHTHTHTHTLYIRLVAYQ